MRNVLYTLLFFITTLFIGCGGGSSSSENTPTQTELNYSWAKQIGSSEYDYAGGITKDSDDLLYIVGSTAGDFEQNNTSRWELMISKYDENESIKNMQIYMSEYQNSAEDITVDENNNLYITGKLGYSSGNRIYLMKLDSNLSKEWTKTLSINSNDEGKKVIYSNNKLYVGGYAGGSSGGNAQIYKLDLNGTIEWSSSIGSTGTDVGHDMAIDTNDNLYITGVTTGTLDGEDKSGNSDAFIVKVSKDGTRYWSEQFGAGDGTTSRANGITIDDSNNLYVVGWTDGILAQSNNGNRDIFITKYDTDGNQIWIKQFGTSISDMALKVIDDSQGNIYILSISQGDFDGQNSNLGDNDLILTKVTSSGTIEYSKHLGTTGNEGEESDIYIDNNDIIYIIGSTTGSVNNSSNLGSSDLFFMKVK